MKVGDRGDDEERFFAKVREAEEPSPNGWIGCWEWTASVTGPGYGQFWSSAQGRLVGAHRFAYEFVVGPIPAGLTIDHLCRNRRCVNPAHLEVTTLKENLARGNSPSAKNAAKDRCVRGHQFAGDNLYLDPRGRRQCKTCRRDAFRKHRGAVATSPS